MSKISKKLSVNNLEIAIKSSSIQGDSEDDFISLTDMAQWKNAEFPADIVKNWMRTKFTI